VENKVNEDTLSDYRDDLLWWKINPANVLVIFVNHKTPHSHIILFTFLFVNNKSINLAPREVIIVLFILGLRMVFQGNVH
jgi:hypothetical protein